MILSSLTALQNDESQEPASEVPSQEPEAGSVSTQVIPPESTGSPEEIWGKFFSRQSVPPNLTREIIQKLHEGRKYDHVVAAIEAALVNGQSQPWMYEVLALTMELEGRPKEEVERALLSSLDVGNKDYESTMYLAAYMVRFNREDRGLSLYREASKINVERPEPYLLGLRLARKMKDVPGIEWGVCGVLRYAWGKDHDAQQKEAQHAAADALKILKDQKDPARTEEFQRALAEAKQRDLYIRVDWNGDADLDLSIQEPGGGVCNSETSRTAGGGRFLHDGFGPAAGRTYDAYLCREGKSGEYQIGVKLVRGKVVANRATLTVIMHQGTPEETTTKSTLTLSGGEAKKSITLTEGRLASRK